MKIAIFCGSKLPEEPIYTETAISLARLFVENNVSLVYGGAKIGIMGIIADEMLRLNGYVIGVMPPILADKEIIHPGLSERIEVKDMSERKTIMNDISDAFIAFPGGCGTLDEIFEVITLNQIGYFNKPVAFANIDHYFDGIEAFLNHSSEVGFVSKDHRKEIVFESDITKVFKAVL